jgi:hypothetical protein
VSSFASSLVIQQAVSRPCRGVRKLKCVAAVQSCTRRTEAHTEHLSKIIFVVGNNNYSSHQPRAASAELLKCDRERTSLLAFVDGEADLFLTARKPGRAE